MGNSEKKIQQLILPTLQDCVRKFVNELEKNQTLSLQKLADTNNRDYQFNKKLDVNSDEAFNFRNNFHTFKNLIRRILLSSKLPEAENGNTLEILAILEILKENNIYDAKWVKNHELAEVINTDIQVSQDAENAAYIQQTLEAAEVNITTEINALILGFTKYKLGDLFQFNDYTKENKGLDISANHPLKLGSYILFEVKINREKSYYPEREHVFQLYENLKRIDEDLKSDTSQIALVSYSQINVEQFESVKFKFLQFAKQLNIPTSYLQRMNFVPAVIMDPVSIDIGIKKLHEKLSSLAINYDFIGAEATKNNHELLPQYFLTNKTEMNVLISPQNTEFWRFGMVLGNEEQFRIDKDSIDRHANLDTVDIHICVGNMTTDGKWHDSNQLSLTTYKAQFIDGEQDSYLEYKQEPVNLKIKFFDGKVSVSIFVAGKDLGTKNFICNRKFVHFMAWCDFKEYHLNASFNVKQIS